MLFATQQPSSHGLWLSLLTSVLFSVLLLPLFFLREGAHAALTAAGSCAGGCDIFLKGQFIEVGIHKVGSYGTSGRCPSTNGFLTFEAHARQGDWNNGLGFIADHNKNGNWGGSSSGGNYEFSGGYFLPGSPLEGWSSEFETSPRVARHSANTLRISPERRRRVT